MCTLTTPQKTISKTLAKTEKISEFFKKFV